MAKYADEVRYCSDLLVTAQKPIRILDSIKWDPTTDEFLKSNGCSVNPQLDAAYYAKNHLRFNPDSKIEELEQLKQLFMNRLGTSDSIGRILIRNADQYIDVVKMLISRGTPAFYDYSRKLYGSSLDTFLDGKTKVIEFGHMLSDIFSQLDDRLLGNSFERNLSAQDVVSELNRRFDEYFHDHDVHVVIDDLIVADAAAGADYVKIRSNAMFSRRDVDILEVHEGWVHLGTSLNGKRQPYATWLAKGPPGVTAIQEGLAVLMELISFVTYPTRARRLINRVKACYLAEMGASVIELYDFFRSQKMSEDEALDSTERIFRGSCGVGYPFTKDVTYCKGFILIFNFMRIALKAGKVEYLPYLFVGKTMIEDIPILYRAAQEGLVAPPEYLPTQFRDLNALATWMSYSNFFNRVQLDKVYDYYKPLFDEHA
jgi:uncharacterized protein (TIGR02421 family)